MIITVELKKMKLEFFGIPTFVLKKWDVWLQMRQLSISIKTKYEKCEEQHVPVQCSSKVHNQGFVKYSILLYKSLEKPIL